MISRLSIPEDNSSEWALAGRETGRTDDTAAGRRTTNVTVFSGVLEDLIKDILSTSSVEYKWHERARDAFGRLPLETVADGGGLPAGYLRRMVPIRENIIRMTTKLIG